MRIKGIVLEVAVTDGVYQGEATKKASFKFLVNTPSQLLTVRLSKEQIGWNYQGILEKQMGKEHELALEFREMSFAGEGGKHIEMVGFALHNMPEHLLATLGQK